MIENLLLQRCGHDRFARSKQITHPAKGKLLFYAREKCSRGSKLQARIEDTFLSFLRGPN